jgi:hypothetical protein
MSAAATNGASERAAVGESVGAKVPASPAARSRAYRARKRQQLDASVTMPSMTVTPTRRDGTVTAITFAAGLALAGVSGSFSIIGMTHVFAGATLPVMAMAGAMEFGKIAGVMWLGRRHAPLPIKAAIVVLVVALMAITSTGVFGFLSAAHLARVVGGQVALDGRTAEVTARMQVQAAVVADLDRRLGQIDRAIDETTRRGHTRFAMGLATQQARNRGDLLAERTSAATKLGAMQVEAAGIAGERQKLAADSGPVRYLAELMHVNDTALLRLFILVIAALIDPLALILLLAVASTSRRVS